MANNSLAGRANSKWLFEFLIASTGHPGQFWSESFDMLCFFLDKTAWNEQREVGIDNPGFFEPRIHKLLNILPDCIAIGSNDHAAAHRRIVSQLRPAYYLVIPL